MFVTLAFVEDYGDDIKKEQLPIYKMIRSLYGGYPNFIAIVTWDIILAFVQIICGIIGIAGPDLKGLYIYTASVVFDMVFRIAMIGLSSFIIISMAHLAMMYFLIREVKRGNALANVSPVSSTN